MSESKDDVPYELEPPPMLVSTVDGELDPSVEEPVVSLAKANKKDRDRETKFTWNHGITLPLKNVRKRRFRKIAKKKYIESPDVEKEVKRLLRTNAEAVSTCWEVIAEEETKEADNHGSLTSLDISSPRMSGHKQSRGSLAGLDALWGLFKDVSSTGSDEDERDCHDDEDLIMDIEEDLERTLQGKMNETIGQQQENERAHQKGLDALWEQFKDVSSTGSDEDERDCHDDEDLIMDIEEDLERTLQGKMNETSGQQQENERAHQKAGLHALWELFKDVSSTGSDEDERDLHDDEDLNIMETEEDLEMTLQEEMNETSGQQQENEGAN